MSTTGRPMRAARRLVLPVIALALLIGAPAAAQDDADEPALAELVEGFLAENAPSSLGEHAARAVQDVDAPAFSPFDIAGAVGLDDPHVAIDQVLAARIEERLDLWLMISSDAIRDILPAAYLPAQVPSVDERLLVGARFGASLPPPFPLGGCDDLLREVGIAGRAPGSPVWESGFDGDLFNGANVAHVARCQDGAWQPPVRILYEGGAWVEHPGTAPFAIGPGGWVAVLPDELEAIRWFGFATSAQQPYHPDLVAASSHPDLSSTRELLEELAGLIDIDALLATDLAPEPVDEPPADEPVDDPVDEGTDTADEAGTEGDDPADEPADDGQEAAVAVGVGGPLTTMLPWLTILVGVTLAGTGLWLRRRAPTAPGEDPASADVTDPTGTAAVPSPADAATVPAPAGGTIAATDPCARLERAYAAARAAADQARTEADRTRQEAETARERAAEADDGLRDADAQLREAEAGHREATPPAGEEESWIEDAETGRRITGRDLRLRREASERIWDECRSDPSPEAAQEVTERWNELDEPAATAARREAEDADLARREQDLASAQEAQREAAARARQARTAADEAERGASAAARAAEEAEAAAARAREHLERCRGLAGGAGSTATDSGSAGGTTTQPGTTGIAHDDSGGCYPEGSTQRVVLDELRLTALVGYDIRVEHEFYDPAAGAALSSELGEVADAIGGISTLLSVKGALSLLRTRDGVKTAVTGGKQAFTAATGVPLTPTDPVGWVTTITQKTAEFGQLVARKCGEWTAQKGDVTVTWTRRTRAVSMRWVEIHRCVDGVVRCDERLLEAEYGPIREQHGPGVGRDGPFLPRDAERAANGWAARFEGEFLRAIEQIDGFEQQHSPGPCG